MTKEQATRWGLYIAILGLIATTYFSYKSNQTSQDALRLSKQATAEQEQVSRSTLSLQQRSMKLEGPDLVENIGVTVYPPNGESGDYSYWIVKSRTVIPESVWANGQRWALVRFSNVGQRTAYVIDVGMAVSKSIWNPVSPSDLWCEANGATTWSECTSSIAVPPGEATFAEFDLTAGILAQVTKSYAKHALKICFDASTDWGCVQTPIYPPSGRW
jgi:hypothetical protein